LVVEMLDDPLTKPPMRVSSISAQKAVQCNYSAGSDETPFHSNGASQEFGKQERRRNEVE